MNRAHDWKVDVELKRDSFVEQLQDVRQKITKARMKCNQLQNKFKKKDGARHNSDLIAADERMASLKQEQVELNSKILLCEHNIGLANKYYSELQGERLQQCTIWMHRTVDKAIGQGVRLQSEGLSARNLEVTMHEIRDKEIDKLDRIAAAYKLKDGETFLIMVIGADGGMNSRSGVPVGHHMLWRQGQGICMVEQGSKWISSRLPYVNLLTCSNSITSLSKR
jgi:hypothetical protein